PGGALPVRLAPVTCPTLADANVRAALRVEIRERLVPEPEPAPPDFALVSVACAGEDVNLLVVRQEAGTAVRRLVPLAGVAPDARPRAVAIAIAELLRVDLARNEPPPPPAPSLAIPRKLFFAVDASPFVAGRYFIGTTTRWFTGSQLRASLDSAIDPGAGRRWGWGLALMLDLDEPGSSNRAAAAGGLAALIRRQGALVTWELGFGARIGDAWDDRLNASPSSARFFGPFGSLAVEAQSYGRLFSRMAIDAGSDSGPLGGVWGRLIVAAGLRL
ncbi:MAG TPA: hypothetical protein VLT58_05425, partial [Polyangia bacterium]|nr:hypothetical protein [Polyangia bacterium]